MNGTSRSLYSTEEVQSYYYGSPEHIADRILWIKREQRLSQYRALLNDVQEFGHVWKGVNGTFEGLDVTVIATGVGPSHVGDAVYALHRPGAMCVYSGTCGALKQESQIGDYVVPLEAVCADGFSFLLGHQPMSRVRPDDSMAASVAAYLRCQGHRVRTGASFTTASVVREVDKDFRLIPPQECETIEMGAAAFYAAARATGKHAAALFWITDLPFHQKSFFDTLSAEELRTKQCNYDRGPMLELSLLASISQFNSSTAP